MGLFSLCLILYFFAISFSQLPQTSSSSEIPTSITDRSALISFKSLIHGDPYGVLSSWNDSTHHCDWPGVMCGRRHSERVTSLVLVSFQLLGYISPALGNLTFLRVLNLTNNKLSGGIPEEIGRCRRLQFIGLRQNSLDGNIPSTLSNCSNLKVLVLTYNKLQGIIPPSLGNLSSLSFLGLSGNNIHGEIPSSFGGLQSLTTLGCAINKLSGEIPAILGQLRFLQSLLLGENNLSGNIPDSIYNLSALINLDLSFNFFEGSLPFDMCNAFPNLQTLSMHVNALKGRIPSSISNCSSLAHLELTSNNFTGTIPSNIGSLKNLSWLDLGTNQLEARTPADWSFMDALVNCTFLKTLVLYENKLEGFLPSSVANLSTNLYILALGPNPISGNIPVQITKLINLAYLFMDETHVTGSIPKEIGSLPNLQELVLSNSMILGEIPSSFYNLTRMIRLSLENNMLEGHIPPELGNMKLLQFLRLNHNKLVGEIPKEIMNISSLSTILDLSDNYLNGSLPSEIGNLAIIESMYLSNNRLSGMIPTTIDGCQELRDLNLSGNLFEGSIPFSLSKLKGVELLDLSNNSLSGQVPQFLGTMNLQYLNISFNNFEGELPDQGVFKNITAIDVRGNPKFCGGNPELHLPKCISETCNQRCHFKIILAIVLSIVGVIICFSLITCLLAGRYRRRSPNNSQGVVGITPQYKQVSFDEIFIATNGFSLDNLIGTGSFGAVYKAVMSFENKTTVAVKVLNLEQHGASRSFLSECEALRNIKHRNLIKVLSSCSSIDRHGKDFKALIFEYMSNGSLETWLHPHLCTDRPFRSLSIIQRMNIAIDVATALEYLHRHGSVSIVHCDLKPSNVLLDDDMTAHVGDFGLAKFLAPPNNTFSQTIASTSGIKGSIGYIPPGKLIYRSRIYGMGGKASEQGDMYSYGILLLEMFTGISPTDDRFKDGLSLHNFVAMNFPNKIMDILDQQLVCIDGEENNEDIRETVYDCLVLMIRYGLLCSEESPQERSGIKEVIKNLNSARTQLTRQENNK